MGAFDLEGRRIAITGASGGIGTAAAEICAEQGAQIALCDREAPAVRGPVRGRAVIVHRRQVPAPPRARSTGPGWTA